MKDDCKIFDSWALLAWLLEQQGYREVRGLLEEAGQGELSLLMSWINVGEVYYMAARKRGSQVAEAFLEELPSLPIQTVLPSAEDFIVAARLKATRRISYADAFAAALAIQQQAPVVTGDSELREMGDVLTVEWIGAAAG